MTQAARTVLGAAVPTTVTSSMTNAVPAAGGTFTTAVATGYPTTNYVVVLDRGLATEEKVFCSSRSGTTHTVGAAGRGFDGSTAAAHTSGVATCEHELDALVITALLEHVNTNAAQDHANLVAVSAKGLVGDFQPEAAAAVAGATARWADAGHVHPSLVTPFFELTSTTPISLTSATLTDLTWPFEEDTHSGHVANAAAYTIPAGWDGIWDLRAMAEFAFNATGSRHLIIFKNGAELQRVAVPAVAATYPTRIHIGMLVRLVAADVLKVQGFQDSGGALNVLTATARTGGSFAGLWVRK